MDSCQVQHLEGKLKLPRSKEHLTQGIDNIVGACNRIGELLTKGDASPTPERLCDFNRAPRTRLESGTGRQRLSDRRIGAALPKLAALAASCARKLAPLAMLTGLMAAAGQQNLPCLTNAHQIHLLTPEQAALGYPVRLRANITFYAVHMGELFVQDETAGIYIEIYRGGVVFPMGFRAERGQRVEVTGTSGPGFAPDVIPQKITLLGQGKLPQARAVTAEQISRGQEDCNWVEFTGVVHATNIDQFTQLPALEIVGSGGRVVFPVVDYDGRQARQLIDAEICVRGVCASAFNGKGELLHAMVQVSSMADIEVRKPAPPQPFAVKRRQIGDLMHYAPQEEHEHRVKVQGTVTLQRPGQFLFIADGTRGLYVQTRQPEQVEPGEVVEVLGFPSTGEFISPMLRDATFRRSGKGPSAAPVKIDADTARKDPYDAALVQLEARLLNRVPRLGEELLELRSTNSVFYAQLSRPAAGGESLDKAPNGSRVRLTGICQVRADQYRLPGQPQSFSMLLRSPADVVVLERPSWWTAEHTLWVLAGTLAVFFGSLAWVVVLRQRVAVQTQIIRQKVQREAALEERARIARDLHDDLGAGLTHIAFLSQVAQEEGPCPSPLREHLREISSSAQDSFQALDEIVWVVNPRNDTLDGLANYICHFAEGFFRGTPTRCRLDLPASLPEHPIAPEVRNHLFFAMKEALNNIRKHAQAGEVLLRMRMEENLFSLSIEDNGQGFVKERSRPLGNGLVNMRQRLEQIGGVFELESEPQAGTRIRLKVRIHLPESPEKARHETLAASQPDSPI